MGARSSRRSSPPRSAAPGSVSRSRASSPRRTAARSGPRRRLPGARRSSCAFRVRDRRVRDADRLRRAARPCFAGATMTPDPIISADSHITEPPTMYADHIEPAFRDRAPHLQHIEGAGDIFVIEGMKTPIPMGIVAAAGKPAEQIRLMGTRFEELHRGGWDTEARLADQERDGVDAEILYPTVGMAVCNVRDSDYKKACCD